MLSGKMLKTGILAAAKQLELHSSEVDALNVFPVPDGDTGTNMAMTVSAAARELALVPDECGVDEAAERIASAMLRGARGNSGVILSLIFRGIARSVKGLQSASGSELADALTQGSEAAYKAVMKPTEGTILTVAHKAASNAVESAQAQTADVIAVWNAALQGARDALEQTPNLLPILKEAGVVDAGGQGLVYVMEGLLQGFLGNDPSGNEAFSAAPLANASPRGIAALQEQEITFTYCTEFLAERTPDAEQTDAEALRQALAQLGDCVVIVDDGEVIKGHVHSNVPGTVLNLAQSYGDLVQVKVENMRKQHSDSISGTAQDSAQAAAPTNPPEEDLDASAPITKRCGLVAVANGEGMVNLLYELGVDQVVVGGQSMNASTEELLSAVNRCGAEHVFILPNNKNIIMAAEQVAPLTDRAVHVVHTHSVAQGVGAVVAFFDEGSAEEIHLEMQHAAERVQTALVTYAARDSSLGGLPIRKGAIIGLENGKITQTGDDPVRVAERTARHLVRRHNGTMVTVYSGEGVTEEQTARLLEALEHRYNGSVEISAIPGGQPLYYYMIAVES